MITPCSGKRGCGAREEGGLYACVSTSIFGRPIEEFIIDPAREWKGNCFRAPILYEGQAACHLLIWIGAEFYPFVPDFVEEARVMGVSRRIPKGFPIEKLASHESRMFLIHPQAIPMFEYQIPPSEMCLKSGEEHLCTFDLWPLSATESNGKHEVVDCGEENILRVVTPSISYAILKPIKVPREQPYLVGAFAAFYLTHLEYIDKEGKAPKDLVERTEKVGFDLLVLPD